MTAYEAHAESLSQLEADLGGITPGQVIYGSLSAVPALVGVFSDQQTLVDTGAGYTSISPGTTVIIRKAALPTAIQANAVNFKTGDAIQVTAPHCGVRQCKIVSVDDLYTAWQIAVNDIHQRA